MERYRIVSCEGFPEGGRLAECLVYFFFPETEGISNNDFLGVHRRRLRPALLVLLLMVLQFLEFSFVVVPTM